MREEPGSTLTRLLSVRGRVQGVGYRNYIAYKAGGLGVCGWVRNRLDGSVEVLVHGVPEAVQALIECARRGPRAAQVAAVEVQVIGAAGAPRDFTVRETK
jgi:acylphosphatase